MIIAEIGQAHEGSLGLAHSYIDVLADTGVDAIKFQTHIAQAESSHYEPFRVEFSYEDDTRYNYWRRMEFTPSQWEGLKQHCEDCGLEFISSPFSLAAVDLLEKLGVNHYKIGSGEVSNLLLLDKIAKTGKHILLSSGMSSYQELDNTIEFLLKRKANYSILQCTTAYPTEPKQWGLNVIDELRARYDVAVGFSDHSGDIYACLAAAALGAEIFEFHAVFHKKMFGPDAKSSLTPEQIKKLVQGIKLVKESLSNPVNKSNIDNFKGLKSIFEKSLAINKDLPVGHILQLEDLESKKPLGYGIAASDYLNIIGKRLTNSLKAWSFITEDDIND